MPGRALIKLNNASINAQLDAQVDAIRARAAAGEFEGLDVAAFKVRTILIGSAPDRVVAITKLVMFLIVSATVVGLVLGRKQSGARERMATGPVMVARGRRLVMIVGFCRILAAPSCSSAGIRKLEVGRWRSARPWWFRR